MFQRQSKWWWFRAKWALILKLEFWAAVSLNLPNTRVSFPMRQSFWGFSTSPTLHIFKVLMRKRGVGIKFWCWTSRCLSRKQISFSDFLCLDVIYLIRPQLDIVCWVLLTWALNKLRLNEIILHKIGYWKIAYMQKGFLFSLWFQVQTELLLKILHEGTYTRICHCCNRQSYFPSRRKMEQLAFLEMLWKWSSLYMAVC